MNPASMEKLRETSMNEAMPEKVLGVFRRKIRIAKQNHTDACYPGEVTTSNDLDKGITGISTGRNLMYYLI